MTRIGDIGTCKVIDRNDELAYYVTLALIRPIFDEIKPKFIKHFIESRGGRRELNKLILHHATPIKINKGDIGKIKIPLPPLEKQREIVEILDKFEALTSSISNGLPAEIAARRKQYEYYRAKLLDFKPRA